MLINSGEIIAGKLVLSQTPGFSIPMNTANKYTRIKDMKNLAFALKAGSITEADFKSHGEMVILYINEDAEIAHFNTSLKCQLVKYSDDRKELLIIGYIDYQSMFVPRVNTFKQIDGRQFQTSYLIKYVTKKNSYVMQCLGVKPVILRNKRDAFMLVNERGRVVTNTAAMPNTLVVSPGYTEDLIAKELRCKFKNVIVKSEKDVMAHAKQLVDTSYFYGYSQELVPVLRTQGLIAVNNFHRKSRGFDQHQLNDVTGEVTVDPDDDVVIEKQPVNMEAAGEPA